MEDQKRLRIGLSKVARKELKMKKLIAILLLIFGISCAGKTIKSTCEMLPSSMPTQEELLADSIEQKNLISFENWWKQETIKMVSYFSLKSETTIKLTKKDEVFIDNYISGLVHVVISKIIDGKSAEMFNLYIVVIQSEGTWNISGFRLLPTKEQQMEENNGNKL
ncbi:hypothetical protein LCGC14_1638050 [marine sediment metagenome]|uniref:Uncharacterized protein n=1 Tax=marine sediment metagenome TaxID=412755 RepID=A0A0F9I114_9ZZZZ